MNWQPMNTAPTDGRPVWARGWDWNKEDGNRHYVWVFYEDGDWYTQGAEEDQARMAYLTDWLVDPLNYIQST